MNALTTTNGAAAMVPRNMQDAMEMANMMARTGFLPREIQNPGGALFVMEQSMRWNMSPFAVAMETSFIQGKPMFSGKIVGAAVQSSGVIVGRLSYEYSGSGDNRAVTVRGTLRGEDTPREVTVRAGDAKTANKVWQTQTDQQLAYHGNRVWARRHAPEVMLGVYSPEEFEPVAPRDVPNMAHRHEPGTQGAAMVQLQAPEETVLPLIGPDGNTYQIGAKGDQPAVIRWMSQARKCVAKLESAEALRGWRSEMGPHLAQISETEPEAVAAIEGAVEARLTDFDAPQDQDAAA